MPVGVMLNSMSSMEMTEWFAYFWMKAEAERPRGQTPKQARLVLNEMVKSGRGKRRR